MKCHKLDIFKKHLESGIAANVQNAERIVELDKMLKSANAATALMSIFGLEMTEDSKQKVSSWEAEYENLCKEQ